MAAEGYKALGKIGISYKGEYSSNTAYERLDAVAHNGSTYLAIKDAPDGAPRDDKVNWIYLAKGFSGDIGDSEITFTESETRENIDTGESVKTVFGKIKKWFSDMTVAAFAQVITSNEDLMALTRSGYLADALAVKNQFDVINSKLRNDVYGSNVGYYAEKQYTINDMQNVTNGTIKIINRNGVVSICINNLVCEPDTAILDINPHVGNNFYLYDKSGTGLYIDKSMLYTTKQNIEFMVLSFCL